MGALPQLPNYAKITPDRERMKYVLEHNIQNAFAFCGWVVCDSHDVPQGCAAGWCVMSLMSTDMIADDVFMWVEPEYRTYKNAAMLLGAYVDWSKARGAKLIRASHTGGSFPRGSKEHTLFDALLRRQGFKEVGSIYHYSTYEGDK
jgi:GNAT superfamily N-acetyltransferase